MKQVTVIQTGKTQRHCYSIMFAFSVSRDNSSRQCDTFLQRAVLNFHTTIIIKTTIGFSISMKCISNKNQTIQFHVCRARFCSKQATHTQIKKTVHKKIRTENVMLHTSIIQIE